MTVENEITKRFPSNGALPAEQTAAAAQHSSKEVFGNAGMTESDKQIYKLVENNVGYAGKEFGKNLKVNSKVLTNVIYDNIVKVLNEKFNQDDFVKWVADKLVDSGCITKGQDETVAGKVEEPKEEIVYELDDSQYKDLVDQVNKAVDRIKEKRVELFSLLNEIKQLAGSQETSSLQGENEASAAQGDKSQLIANLVQKIQGNHRKIEEYVVSRQENATKIEDAIAAAQEKLDSKPKVKIGVGVNLNGTLDKIRGRVKEVGKDYEGLGSREFQADVNKFDLFARQKGKYSNMLGQKKPQSGTKIFKKRPAAKLKQKAFGKPTIGSRIKSSIQSSKLFAAIKSISGIIGKTLGAIKKIVKTVFKVGKKIVVGVYKTAKFAAKAFYKAAKFVGKGIQKVGASAVKFIRTAVKTGGKSIKDAIMYGAPIKFVFSLGWKALKFVGKILWRGLKKLVMPALGLLKKMFKLNGGFTNKISTYMMSLSAGIINKTYMFLVKPIANIMVTMVGFAFNVLTSPVQFMKFMIPSVLERLGTVVGNIRRMARSVLQSTWSLFRKIMFNPITITLIIGGLFYFFGPKLFSWLKKGISALIFKVVPAIKSFVGKAIEFLTPVWECLKTVGGWLFSILDWLTDPENWIVRTVWWIVDKLLLLRKWIKNLCRAAGKSAVDTLIMFLTGDWIGIAIAAISTLCMKFWNFLKERGIVKVMIKLVKAIIGINKMILELPIRLIESVTGALGAIIKCQWGDIPEKFSKPWKEWWQNVVGIFQWDEEPKDSIEILKHNPVEKNEEIANETGNALRLMKLRGADGMTATQKMDQIARLKGFQHGQSMHKRVEEMERLYSENSRQVKEYANFISGIWKLAKDTSSENAQRILETLFESPELSQRILSVFFYYNPQTQETMMTRPMPYIGLFVKKLQDLTSDGGDWYDKIQIFIEALEQLNMERSHIINNQGNQIQNFAKNISNVNLKDQKNTKMLEQMVDEFNKGDLFGNMSAASSFIQMRMGQAKTKNLVSITGRQIGNNKLTSTAGLSGAVKMQDFTVSPSQKQQPVGNRITLPPSLNPKISTEAEMTAVGRGPEMKKKYEEYNEKMADLYRQNYTKDEVEAMGYKQLTFDEFRRQNMSVQQLEADRKMKEKEIAGMRTAHSLLKFNETMGKVLGGNALIAMKLEKGGNPGIYSIAGDVNKDVYMFSDDWALMVHDDGISDAELALLVDSDNEMAARQLAREREERLAEEEEAEREKRREEAILDYSAKVVGGYIEIKLGEDVVAMEEAYEAYCEALAQFYREGHTKDEADERGLKEYSWEEWQRYYRKKNGMPEDGIKRIPFEGKKKERNIDWGPRPALSQDELGQYGIEVSPNGPVMVSLDKAMQAAASLLQGAKQIHSIRDGLEVMKMGLDSETSKLKKQREEGVKAAVVKQSPDSGTATVPAPANPSNYSEPG